MSDSEGNLDGHHVCQEIYRDMDNTIYEPNPLFFALKDRWEASDDYESEHGPHVDIVHVAALCPADHMLSLSTLGLETLTMEKQEFICRLPMCNMLHEETELSSAMQMAGDQLLSESKAIREQSSTEGRRAIIFVAYDFGAIVLKTALAAAVSRGREYADIFYGTAAVVFCGCPQRSSDFDVLGTKLYEFLLDKKTDEWASHLTISAVARLARIVLTSTQAFINSKITIRSRVVSLYAEENGTGDIHPALDGYTATLGIPSEFAINKPDKLKKYVAHDPDSWIVPDSWSPWERFLLSVTAPPRPSPEMPCLGTPTASIFEHPAYTAWVDGSGPGILYINGAVPNLTYAMADQLLWRWREEGAYQLDMNSQIVSFTFDRMDPLRNSFSNFVTSALSQLILGNSLTSVEGDYHLLQDQFAFHGGWTETALLSAFDLIEKYETSTVYLLHQFDECDIESRSLFYRYLQTGAKGIEQYLRIVVTSRRPHALLTELSNWPELNTYSLSLDQEPLSAAVCPKTTHRSARDRFVQGLGGRYKGRIKSILDRPDPMGVERLDAALQLVQDHTAWPQLRPGWSFEDVLVLLESIGPNDGVPHVLDRILRRYCSQDGFVWILSWLIATARPLSRREVAGLLCLYYTRCTTPHGSSTRSSPLDLETAHGQLDTWLYGLTDRHQEHLTFRSVVRDIVLERMSGQEQFLWHQVWQQAHQTIAEFCIAHLETPASLSRLHILHEEYQSGLDAQELDRRMTAPLTSDGVDILFYIIEFLPFHLAFCPPAHASAALNSFLTGSAFEPEASKIWAKLYWAMKNPFLRPPGIWKALSAWPTLTGLGLPTPNKSHEDGDMSSLALIVAAFNNREKLVSDLVKSQSFSTRTLVDALVGAVSAGNETTAIQLTQCILESPASSGHSTVFPSSLIWASAWLNLAQLARMLLEHGTPTDPPRETSAGPGNRTPSPLYLATCLCHVSTVKVLLEYRARTDVMIGNKTPASLAILHPQLFIEYTSHESFCFQGERLRAMFDQIVIWGSWWSIPRILGQDAAARKLLSDEIGDSKYTALVTACLYSYPRTAHALLQEGADPNQPGPWCPIWLATVWSPNARLLQVLLEKRADPNNEQLEYPLLYDLVMSPVRDPYVRVLGDILLGNDPPVEINAQTSPNGHTALMGACSRGRIGMVRWLISRDADVTILDDDDETALHHAIRGEHLDVARELLSKHPQLATIDRASQPLLVMARQSAEMVRLLLTAGANPARSNGKGQTVVNCAAVDNLVAVMKILVEEKEKVNLSHRDEWGATPVCDAISYGQDDRILRLLIDNGADLEDTLEDTGDGLLHLALEGKPEIMRTVLEYAKVVGLNRRNKKGETPLLFARSTTNIQCLKMLINAGADINVTDKRGETALHNAIHYEYPMLRDLLLSQHDIKVNIASRHTGAPLHLACHLGQLDTVTALLRHGADVNQTTAITEYSSPLVAAVLQKRAALEVEDGGLSSQDQIVRMLINHGAKVCLSSPGATFYSPLAAACFGASPSTINILLDEGARPETPDPISGRCPLHFAALGGIDNFQLILHATRGTDPALPDRYGKNALHWAAQYGRARTVEHIILAQRRALPSRLQTLLEQADNDDWTPLCWAVRPIPAGYWDGRHSEPKAHPETVRLLLHHGARRDVQARWGNRTFTPLELAYACDAGPEIIDLLQSPSVTEETDAAPSSRIPPRKFTHTSGELCNICLSPLFGLRYTCSACAHYVVCTKCYPIADDFHPRRFPSDELDHCIALDPEREEFQEDAAPSPPSLGDLDHPTTTDTTGGIDPVAVDDLLYEDTMSTNNDEEAFQEMTLDSSGLY